MEIANTVPPFDASTHRMAETFVDTPDPERNRIVRTWGVVPIPYTDLRAAAYPPVGDQLDALVKGFRSLIDAGTALPQETVEWVRACEAVKAAHPKPGAVA